MSQSPMMVSLTDEAATAAFGRRLGCALLPSLPQAVIVYLSGPLGAGKTTLARGLLRELGVSGPIRSPSFTLLELYETSELVGVHLDLYRLSAAAELEQLGLRDLLQQGYVWLIEWPERGGKLLPPADLQVELSFEGEGRTLQLTALSAAGQQVVSRLALRPVS